MLSSQLMWHSIRGRRRRRRRSLQRLILVTFLVMSENNQFVATLRLRLQWLWLQTSPKNGRLLCVQCSGLNCLLLEERRVGGVAWQASVVVVMRRVGGVAWQASVVVVILIIVILCHM